MGFLFVAMAILFYFYDTTILFLLTQTTAQFPIQESPDDRAAYKGYQGVRVSDDPRAEEYEIDYLMKYVS